MPPSTLARFVYIQQNGERLPSIISTTWYMQTYFPQITRAVSYEVGDSAQVETHRHVVREFFEVDGARTVRVVFRHDVPHARLAVR